MITVHIGANSRDLSSISDGWINEQIERRRDDRISVCVRVEIRCRLANMTLSTPGCGGYGGGGRRPSSVEQQLFELWDAWKLNTSDFPAGNLIGFLKRAGGLAC